jgi:hypothetical protein
VILFVAVSNCDIEHINVAWIDLYVGASGLIEVFVDYYSYSECLNLKLAVQICVQPSVRHPSGRTTQRAVQDFHPAASLGMRNSSAAAAKRGSGRVGSLFPCVCVLEESEFLRPSLTQTQGYGIC